MTRLTLSLPHRTAAHRTSLMISLPLALVLGACDSPPPAPSGTTARPATSAQPAKQAASMARVKRAEFNRFAAELFAPLFWLEDVGKDGRLDPQELVVLSGMGSTSRSEWVDKGAFTPRFKKLYEQMVALDKGEAKPDRSLEPSEIKRREAVRKELAQGRPMVVRSDFRKASAQDRAIVTHIMAAAEIIERIFAKQMGWAPLVPPQPPDAASRMLLHRNQGPWCVAPATEKDEFCNALPSRPKPRSGLYPEALQTDGEFCKKLGERENGEKLLNQFVVVVEKEKELQAIPYTEMYREDMKAIAAELEKAAEAIKSEDESAFKAYLEAAAKAFGDNEWYAADEAWAKMNAQNSHWYLRIGPDEVYFEPCNRKAGFHVSFARINQESLAWQKKLDPVKNDLENELAKLAGEPYQAREVSFHLPDFIDIVLNAGDARSPAGATIGQSLPNWGPVANEGRGRTVAMTNLYTDPDSRAVLASQAASLWCPATYETFTTEAEPMTMSTVLHEAAHNLGPSHEYRVKGKKASELFGGPLATTLEELKAQTAALFFADWLAGRKIIEVKLAEQSHVRDLTWAFGHISRGMYTATGKPRSYSQLAAIQLAYLVEHGAAEWRGDSKAHNGKDIGCLELHLDKMPKVVEQLMGQVAGIKARGDVPAAKKLIADYVDVEGKRKELLDLITKRWLRAPKATFVYAVEM